MKKRIIQVICFTALVIFLAGLIQNHRVMAEPPANNYIFSSVTVSKPLSPQTISPFIWGAQFYDFSHLTATDYFANFISVEKLKSLGIKLLRTPDGCMSDSYHWKDSNLNYINGGKTTNTTIMNIDEFLNVAQKIGAEVLYSINVETIGLPNPCGDYSQNLGSIADAVDLVTKYKGRIKYYELGNESWGSWDPVEYGQVALEFAQAIKQIDNTVKISIQGFPTSGNNQDPNQQTSSKDVAWTNMIKGIVNNQCSGVPCFDFVTDHPYEYSGFHPYAANLFPNNFPGIAAYYPLTNYSWMFDQRKSDYAPAKYDITEWNMRCWGALPGQGDNITLNNPSFENGTGGWSYWSRNPNTGSMESSRDSSFDGSSALKLVLGPASGQPLDDNQAYQVINTGPGKTIQAFTYVKTNHPANVNFIIQQSNPGPHQYAHLGESSLQNIKPNIWQPVVVGGTTFDDTTQVQIVLRNTKTKDQWATDSSSVITYFDKVWAVYYPAGGDANPAINTVEQGMFILESMLQMAQKGVHANIYFLIYNDGGCSLFSLPGNNLSAPGQAFTLTSVLAGGELLDSNSNSPQKHIPLDPDCTSAGCIRGDVDAPYVSSYSGISPDGTTYVFIINRHDSLAANTTVNLSGLANVGIGNITAKYLTANNYTDTVFGEHDETMLLPANKTLAVNVPPVSVVRLQIPPSGSVRGCKIMGTSGDCYDAANSAFDSTQVMLDGVAATAQGNSAANSYAFPDVSAGSHTIAVPLPPSGYILSGYSLCINQVGCHATLTGTSSSVSVDVPAGGYADLWWHFSPVYTPTAIPTPTPFTSTPIPTISAIDISAQASIPGDLTGDNIVKYDDIDILKADFGNTGSPGFTPSDINKDGIVDIFDYNIQVGNFRK